MRVEGECEVGGKESDESGAKSSMSLSVAEFLTSGRCVFECGGGCDQDQPSVKARFTNSIHFWKHVLTVHTDITPSQVRAEWPNFCVRRVYTACLICQRRIEDDPGKLQHHLNRRHPQIDAKRYFQEFVLQNATRENDSALTKRVTEFTTSSRVRGTSTSSSSTKDASLLPTKVRSSIATSTTEHTSFQGAALTLSEVRRVTETRIEAETATVPNEKSISENVVQPVSCDEHSHSVINVIKSKVNDHSGKEESLWQEASEASNPGNCQIFHSIQSATIEEEGCNVGKGEPSCTHNKRESRSTVITEKNRVLNELPILEYPSNREIIQVLPLRHHYNKCRVECAICITTGPLFSSIDECLEHLESLHQLKLSLQDTHLIAFRVLVSQQCTLCGASVICDISVMSQHLERCHQNKLNLLQYHAIYHTEMWEKEGCYKDIVSFIKCPLENCNESFVHSQGAIKHHLSNYHDNNVSSDELLCELQRSAGANLDLVFIPKSIVEKPKRKIQKKKHNFAGYSLKKTSFHELINSLSLYMNSEDGMESNESYSSLKEKHLSKHDLTMLLAVCEASREKVLVQSLTCEIAQQDKGVQLKDISALSSKTPLSLTNRKLTVTPLKIKRSRIATPEDSTDEEDSGHNVDDNHIHNMENIENNRTGEHNGVVSGLSLMKLKLKVKQQDIKLKSNEMSKRSISHLSPSLGHLNEIVKRRKEDEICNSRGQLEYVNTEV